MKKYIFLFIGLISLSTSLLAQGCINDLVVKMDGEILQVTITEVENETISFQYPGEALNNKLDKNKIQRIILKSGREQIFQPIKGETLTAKGAELKVKKIKKTKLVEEKNAKTKNKAIKVNNSFENQRIAIHEKYAAKEGETEKDQSKREKALEKELKEVEKKELIQKEIELEKEAELKLEKQRIADKEFEEKQLDRMEKHNEISKNLEGKEITLENLETNTIAVLPPHFVLEKEYSSSNSASSQTYILDFLTDKDKKISLEAQPKRTTNALMFKNKITGQNVINFPIEDLAKVTGTEYFLVTEIELEFDKYKKQSKKDIEREKEKEKKYNTVTRMWIYKYDGTVVYEDKVTQKNVKAKLELEKEEWQNQIKFMFKKSPFYFK